MLDGVRAHLATAAGDHATAQARWRPLIDFSDRSHAVFYGTHARIEAARAAVAAGVRTDPDLLEDARRAATGMQAGLMLRWISEIEQADAASAG
jgi:hypothetical protein